MTPARSWRAHCVKVRGKSSSLLEPQTVSRAWDNLSSDTDSAWAPTAWTAGTKSPAEYVDHEVQSLLFRSLGPRASQPLVILLSLWTFRKKKKKLNQLALLHCGKATKKINLIKERICLGSWSCRGDVLAHFALSVGTCDGEAHHGRNVCWRKPIYPTASRN